MPVPQREGDATPRGTPRGRSTPRGSLSTPRGTPCGRSSLATPRSTLATPRGLLQLSIAEGRPCGGSNLDLYERLTTTERASQRSGALTPRLSARSYGASPGPPCCSAPAVATYEASEEDECCICLSDTRARTACKHPVCFECLRQLALAPPGLCPLCRRVLFEGYSETPLYSARHRDSNASHEQYVELIGEASLGELRRLVTRIEATPYLIGNEASLSSLRSACAARVIELVSAISFRDLARNIETFRRLKAARLLPWVSGPEFQANGLITPRTPRVEVQEAAMAAQVSNAIEHALVACFKVRFTQPDAEELQIRPGQSYHPGRPLTLQSLQPAANMLMSFREMGILRSQGTAAAWLTEHVVSIVKDLPIDSTFPQHVSVACEICDEDRSAVEQVVLQRWQPFMESDESVGFSGEELDALHAEIFASFLVVLQTPRALSARRTAWHESEMRTERTAEMQRAERERTDLQCEEVERLAIERRLRERLKLEAEQEADRREKEAAERDRLRIKEEQEAAERQHLELQQEKFDQDQTKVEEFLASHGYAGINAKRRKRLGLRSKYPLHTAVKGTDTELVVLLLAAKADPMLKNSAGKRPAEVVQQINTSGKNPKAAMLRLLVEATKEQKLQKAALRSGSPSAPKNST